MVNIFEGTQYFADGKLFRRGVNGTYIFSSDNDGLEAQIKQGHLDLSEQLRSCR